MRSLLFGFLLLGSSLLLVDAGHPTSSVTTKPTSMRRRLSKEEKRAAASRDYKNIDFTKGRPGPRGVRKQAEQTEKRRRLGEYESEGCDDEYCEGMGGYCYYGECMFPEAPSESPNHGGDCINWPQICKGNEDCIDGVCTDISGDCDWDVCVNEEEGMCMDDECGERGCKCVYLDTQVGYGPGLWAPEQLQLPPMYPKYPDMPTCLCQGCGVGPGCGDGEGVDDPHFKTWSGEWFDYHGQCDLKFMHAPAFDGHQNMDINIRTKIRYDYSYIEAAAVKIGQDILEVGSFGSYALNGVEEALKPNSMSVPTVGGYPVYHTQVSDKKHKFDIVMDRKNVTLSTFKDWVSVHIHNGDPDAFVDIQGLIGSALGRLLGRDGTDLHDDLNAYGQEWQIRPHEEMLFRTAREPQAPQPCILPDPQAKAAAQRRLGQGIARSEAEQACAQFKGHAFSFCVHDVIASGDLEVAQSQTF